MTTLARRARLYSQFGAALLVLWLLRRYRQRVAHWLQLAVLHGATAAVLALRALLHRVHLFLNWLLPKDFSVFVRRARLPHNRRRITDNRSYPAILTVDFDFPKAPPQRAKPTRRRQPAPVVCFSFAGCAWMLHYHFGAAMFLYDKVGPEWLSHCHFLGSSRCVAPPVAVALPAACCHVTCTLPLVFRCSGSLIAACLACGVAPSALMPFMAEMADLATTRFMGPLVRATTRVTAHGHRHWSHNCHFMPISYRSLRCPRVVLAPSGQGIMTQIVRQGITSVMPHDAHARATGRLFVSISVPTSLRQWLSHGPLVNRLVSTFRNNDELIDALLASCYIPVYYERPALFKGTVVLDGGLTDNLPVSPLHPHVTVTVSPNEQHDADVRPPESRVYPEWFSLFPTNAQDLEAIRQDGYVHMAMYMSKHGPRLLQAGRQ